MLTFVIITCTCTKNTPRRAISASTSGKLVYFIAKHEITRCSRAVQGSRKVRKQWCGVTVEQFTGSVTCYGWFAYWYGCIAGVRWLAMCVARG